MIYVMSVYKKRLVNTMGTEILLTAEERGIVKGIESTKIEDVTSLMETLKLTLEQALDALKIVGDERTLIIGKLQKR